MRLQLDNRKNPTKYRGHKSKIKVTWVFVLCARATEATADCKAWRSGFCFSTLALFCISALQQHTVDVLREVRFLSGAASSWVRCSPASWVGFVARCNVWRRISIGRRAMYCSVPLCCTHCSIGVRFRMTLLVVSSWSFHVHRCSLLHGRLS